MSRPKLHLARAPRKPSLAQLKAALRKWKRPGVPKATYRHNAMSWLRAVEQLGAKHALHRSKPQLSWGIPGVPVGQVYAPRRFGGV